MSTPAERMTPRIQNQILFWVGILFVLIAPAWIAIRTSSAPIAGVLAACGAFIAMMSRFDDIAELSLGPLKARMREAVAEATAKVTQLRELAASIARGFNANLIWSSFLGGMPLARRMRIHDDLMAKLRSLGVSEDQIRDADVEWKKGLELVYHNIIVNEIKKLPSGQSLFVEMHQLLDHSTLSVPPPGTYQSFAEARNLLTPDVMSWIDDFRHFRETGEIRRPEKFIEKFVTG